MLQFNLSNSGTHQSRSWDCGFRANQFHLKDSGSGTHQTHLMGAKERSSTEWFKKTTRGLVWHWEKRRWRREIQSACGGGSTSAAINIFFMKLSLIVWGAGGHKGNWIIYEQHFGNSGENLWIGWCMSSGLILWQSSNALINGCYLHPLVYDGHLLWTP